MPTILRDGPYRFFFYAGDGGEPPHVHVERDGAEAKFWLNPVRLARSRGFSAHELSDLEDIVVSNEQAFTDAWNEFFID